MPPLTARFAGFDLRWVALAVLAASELLIVVDATIVNVALPAIQADLDLGSADLQWVVSAYTLAFGGFLLLGGRLADRLGRRRMFTIGAGVFALGSLLAGLAQSAAPLIAGRALQGVASAVLAPSGLSLVMVVFVEGRQRDRALGVWASVAGSGAAVGVLLGGVLTQVLSWQWVFWVTVPVAAAAAICARVVLPKDTVTRGTRFDLAGAVLATGGLTALVYALVRTPELGWVSLPTLSIMLLATGALVIFAWLQHVRVYALVPVRVLRARNVLGADLVGLAYGAAIYALFFFASLFLGGPLGYTPLQIGLAFLPIAVTILGGAQVAGKLLGWAGPKPLVLTGTLVTAGGLLLLARIHPEATYLATLLPGLLGAGFGMGLAFVALTSAAVGGVAERDSGVASGLFQASHQIGGALGLALFTAISNARTQSLAGPAATPTPDALTAGWSLSFLLAAGVMVLAAIVTATAITENRAQDRITTSARPN